MKIIKAQFAPENHFLSNDNDEIFVNVVYDNGIVGTHRYGKSDELQSWIEEGNTPEPAPEPPAPQELTVQEKLQAAGLTIEELKEALGL